MNICKRIKSWCERMWEPASTSASKDNIITIGTIRPPIDNHEDLSNTMNQMMGVLGTQINSIQATERNNDVRYNSMVQNTHELTRCMNRMIVIQDQINNSMRERMSMIESALSSNPGIVRAAEPPRNDLANAIGADVRAQHRNHPVSPRNQPHGLDLRSNIIRLHPDDEDAINTENINDRIASSQLTQGAINAMARTLNNHLQDYIGVSLPQPQGESAGSTAPQTREDAQERNLDPHL